MGRQRRRLIGAVAAMLALTGAIMAATAGASGEHQPPPPVPESPLGDLGVVRLHLGYNDYVRFDAADGAGGYTPGTPAPITVSKCVATVAAGPLTFTTQPAGSQLGLAWDGLGVKTAAESKISPSCGQVDGTAQALDLALAGPVADGEIDYAELDIDPAYKGVVLADLYLDGALVGTEQLDTRTTNVSALSSGDDWYHFHDNRRWRIPAEGFVAFDRVVLRNSPTTPKGSFALEGGADFTHPGPLGQALQTKDSLFHITDLDGTLDCGDAATEGGADVPDATFERQDNAAGTPEDCEPIPYLLRTGNEGELQLVEIIKDLGDQAGLVPQFTLNVVWEPEPAALPITRVTQIDYNDGAGPQPIQWCNGLPGEPTLPEGQLWCLSSQASAPAGTGLIVVTEDYFGAGDPRFLR